VRYKRELLHAILDFFRAIWNFIKQLFRSCSAISAPNPGFRTIIKNAKLPGQDFASEFDRDIGKVHEESDRIHGGAKSSKTHRLEDMQGIFGKLDS
jgi:hypothetical protein